MKILHLAIATAIGIAFLLSFGNTAHGIWVPESTHDLLEKSATIFVGNITATKVLQFEEQYSYLAEENGTDKNITKNYMLNLDEYTVDVEEYLKNPQNSTKITVRQPTVGIMGELGGLDGFRTGDHVLFYVEKLDGNNTYSPESFILPTICNGKDVLTQERPEGGSEFTVIQNGVKVDYGNFTANKPIQFLSSKDMGTLSGKSYDLDVGITRNSGGNTEAVFSKEIHSSSKPCEWVATAEWEFTPQEGNYRMGVITKEGGIITGTSDTGFTVKSDTIYANQMSPLEQFKSGIPTSNVKCNDGLQLVIKAEDSSPACVKTETAQKLIERGWAIKNTSLNYSRVPTKISSQVFPTNAALSVGEPSVKGYLTSTDGTAFSDKQISIIIDNATFENGTSIENILLGKTFTDQDGCFYLAGWDQDAADRFQKDMAEKTPRFAPTDIVSIKAVFTGDSKYQGSSNATKFIYYTVAVPIIRPAISAFLVNGSDIVLEKGKSYNFTDFSTWGEALQLHTLSIEMKNLPCGIYETTREISVADNQTQVIMPIELRVEKTAPVGNFTTYISVNNQALEPINLEIK